MKRSSDVQLPLQDLLNQQFLQIVPLEDYSNELSEVPHRHDAHMLMLAEETKGGDNLIIFTVMGEVLLLGIAWPNLLGNMGMFLIMTALILYSLPARLVNFNRIRLRNKMAL